jgi:aminopeptidase-like protein
MRTCPSLQSEASVSQRRLYSTLGTAETKFVVADMMNFIAYADGKNDLIEISDVTGASVEKRAEIAKKLVFFEVCEH